MWQMDVRTMAWIRLVADDTPGPRYGHAAATAGGRIYEFGGLIGSGTEASESRLSLSIDFRGLPIVT